jgi:ADP-heptose:LPS heptosyltransferase
VVWYSRAPYRVGFSFRFRKYAYTHIINRRSSEVHNLDFNLDALKHIGIPILSRQPEIYLNFVHTEFADKFINENNLNEKNLLGILISGGWETKKFKIDGYKKLIKKILELYNIKIIIFQGNQTEENQAKQLKSFYDSECYISPNTNLKYTSALMKKCKAIIGNDSGLLHLAVASKVPVLGIYGPTDPKLQGPFGEKNLYVENESIDCLHCNLQVCKIGNICMTQLDTDYIISKFVQLLKINNIYFE